jgi:nicotinic acid phosphoribosyltransferase
MLIDTYNREIDDTLASLKIAKIGGIRIDTCGENTSQGGDFWKNLDKDIPEKYLSGRGVTINSVWALKLKLHEMGFDDIKITVSSGFNPEKTAAFIKADEMFQEKYKTPLFDTIGTGSIYPGVVMATSDIVAYYSEKDKKWLEHHKVGRGENPSKRLSLHLR